MTGRFHQLRVAASATLPTGRSLLPGGGGAFALWLLITAARARVLDLPSSASAVNCFVTSSTPPPPSPSASSTWIRSDSTAAAPAAPEKVTCGGGRGH